MPFARAVLAACAAVLGFIFYAIAGLLVVLAIANAFRANVQGAPATTTLALAVGAMIVGYACRFIARRIV